MRQVEGEIVSTSYEIAAGMDGQIVGAGSDKLSLTSAGNMAAKKQTAKSKSFSSAFAASELKPVPLTSADHT